MRKITFKYNDRGFGDLQIFEESISTFSIPARTGSIDNTGKLVKAIPVGTWYLMKKSVNTDEKGMYIAPEKQGWKIRLYDKDKKFTHYLIHPDGNLPGSKGCIVTFSMAPILRVLLDSLLSVGGDMLVEVSNG